MSKDFLSYISYKLYLCNHYHESFAIRQCSLQERQ